MVTWWLKHDPIKSDFSRISTSHIHINMSCSSTLCADWLHLQYSLAPHASEVSVFASSCSVEHKNNGRLQAALSPIAWKSPWLKSANITRSAFLEGNVVFARQPIKVLKFQLRKSETLNKLACIIKQIFLVHADYLKKGH